MTELDASTVVEVRGYQLFLDRRYDPDTHLWVLLGPSGTARVGLDPLGVEMNGTLAALSFVAPGEEVVRGQAFGQLEAAKFVGPLLCPLSGTVEAVNDAALADPALVERDPLGAGWLVDIKPSGELPALLRSPQDVINWFTAKVDDYRRKGVIAE